MVILNMKKNAIWNEEKLKKLEDLWKQGLPISKIGELLGVSRNSIAGKAHRMSLPKRNSPISGKEKTKSQKTTSNQNTEIPLKLKLRNVEWSRTRCCWPKGDPKLQGFKFCGAEIFPGRPYCDKHSYLAYTNAREIQNN